MKRKSYIITDSTLIAVIMAFSLTASGIITAAAAETHVEESIVRLHILADSDSEKDQQLKIMVRDEILAHSEELFKPYSSSEEAAASLEAQLPVITEIAENALAENGCTDKVSCEILQMPFDTRVYDGFTVPAGDYTALRIKIGSGSGKNWWCVMYPPLCVPCAGIDSEEIMEKYGGELSEEDIRLLTESGDYEARLYIAELLKELFSEE